MAHENSETVKVGSTFFNILGKRGRQAKPLLPIFGFESPFYGTLAEATRAAKQRSEQVTPALEIDPFLALQQRAMPQLFLEDEAEQLNKNAILQVLRALSVKNSQEDISQSHPDLYNELLLLIGQELRRR